MTLNDREWLSKIFNDTQRCAGSLRQLSFLYNITMALSCKISEIKRDLGWNRDFYRTTRMHSADYAVARCLSVCPSVCHTVVLCLNGYTYPQNCFHHRVAPPFYCFSIPNGMAIFPRGPPLTWASNATGYEKNHDFRPVSRFISQIMQDKAIVNMEAFE